MIYEVQAQEGEHGTHAYYDIDTDNVAAVKTAGANLVLFMKGGGTISMCCYSALLAQQYREDIVACMKTTLPAPPATGRYSCLHENVSSKPAKDSRSTPPAPPPPTKDIRSAPAGYPGSL